MLGQPGWIPIGTECPTRAKRPAFPALNCSLIKNEFGINPILRRDSLEATIQVLLEMESSANNSWYKNPTHSIIRYKT